MANIESKSCGLTAPHVVDLAVFVFPWEGPWRPTLGQLNEQSGGWICDLAPGMVYGMWGEMLHFASELHI